MDSSSHSYIEAIRREYNRDGISEENVQRNPIDQFTIWFEDALNSNLTDANAMTLSTSTLSGKPSSRVVLLKGFDKKGFRFYTNYRSRKVKELNENPSACLCFYWSALERQVRIEGKVEKLSHEQSTEYFQSRPRASQIAAWASPQSSELKDRQELEKNFQIYKEKFEGEEVPLPDFWGGFLVVPEVIEFWQGRASRLHDRIVYFRDNESWKIKRISP